MWPGKKDAQTSKEVGQKYNPPSQRSVIRERLTTLSLLKPPFPKWAHKDVLIHKCAGFCHKLPFSVKELLDKRHREALGPGIASECLVFVVALRTGTISAWCSALEKMQKAASPTQMGPISQQGQVLTPTSMKTEPVSSWFAADAPNSSALTGIQTLCWLLLSKRTLALIHTGPVVWWVPPEQSSQTLLAQG